MPDSPSSSTTSSTQPLLRVEGLETVFETRQGVVRAVDGVSFNLNPGETLGIVGESGSGKSVTCYSMMGLIPQPPGRIKAGHAWFEKTDLLHCSTDELNAIRGKRVSMIFQDPMTSLNPYMRIEEQLIEPLLVHKITDRKTAKRKAVEMLDAVGIPDARRRVRFYPHEFSGGMRQRVMIAMALITKPDLLIADEPTTALDVTVQAQILELIADLQKSIGMAVILITHDLGVVAGFCDRINVMYAGQIVESGTADDIFYRAQHAYTVALRKSIPSLQSKGEPLFTIPGAPPQLIGERPPCAFASRSHLTFTEEEGNLPSQVIEVAPGHLVEAHPATVENYAQLAREHGLATV